ncbi:MAG: hypothetical protein E6H00_12900 [Bacillati bacterium ANGP1]|uniref:Uncharacterized protein n=1 Tax=Candidatus Segetimicrobium genomatis TaxID=2569760 RepID=A0A537JXU3_9BACT|nr:MAG: hypothetical protein E6H00_12900 [Terrabacteria group bacterium ANGP1]
MKLFNVQLMVSISLIGEMEPPPEPSITENLPDDPVKASAVMLERYAKITLEKPSSQYMGPYAGPEGVSMNKSVKIAASSFVDLQEILAKFNATLVSLSPDAELDQLGKKAGHAA